MSQTLLSVAIICLAGLVTAEQSTPAFFYPVEQRNNIERFPLSNYEFEIIPNDQYPVQAYDPSTVSFSLSPWDIISSPVTALITIATKAVSLLASTALSVGWFIVTKGLFIIIGMGIVVGTCAFTSFCTLIIEKPLIREIDLPYLNAIEDFLSTAYDKYNSIQIFK